VNQGAESTIALVATLQYARALAGREATLREPGGAP
jgi:hypothetical protein